MKFVLIEFIDEFEAFQAFLQKSKQTLSEFTLIALEPRVQAFLKKRNIAYRTTLPYFTNGSHKRILMDSERVMQYIRDHFTFSDENGLRNCYQTDLTHYIRLYVNHMLKMLEILEHIHREDRNCELFAFVDYTRSHAVMITDAERYAGCLAERFAKARGLRFTNISPTVASRRSDAPAKTKGTAFARSVTAATLWLLSRRKVIIVPIGGGSFKELLATLSKRDKRIAYLVVGSAAGSIKLLAFNIASLFRSFLDSRHYPYYLVDTECFYAKNSQELGRMSSNLDSLMGPAGQGVFTYQGTDYSDLVRNKVEIGIKAHLARMIAQSHTLRHLLHALPHRMIMSFLSIGIMAIAGELSRTSGVRSLFVSHGAHPVPVDSFHEIELLNLCRGFMLSDYTHIALSTPVQEEHLHYFKRKYPWVGNTEILTGPLIFTITEGIDKSTCKRKIGISENDFVITHAITQKYRNSERLYFIESLDESFSSMSEIVKSVDKMDNVRVIFRIHPGFHMSNDEIATLLPESARYVIQREGHFSEVLAATDLLISYSSTVIDEALINGIPVLLFDAWNRYNHFRLPAYEDKATSAVFPVCYVNARDRLREALVRIIRELSGAQKPGMDISKYRYAKDYRDNLNQCIEEGMAERPA